MGYRIGDAYHPVRTDFSQSGRFLFSSEYKTLIICSKLLKYNKYLGLQLHKLHATNPFQLFVRVAGLIDTQALDKSHPRLERWRARSRRPYNDEPFLPDMHQTAEKCFLESHLARMRDQAGAQLSGGERVGAFASQIEPRVMELEATGLGMCPEVSVVARINAWFARNLGLPGNGPRSGYLQNVRARLRGCFIRFG